MENTVKTEKNPRRRRISLKAFAILFAVVVVLVGIIWAAVAIGHWRNNGAAYARSLAEQIGVSPETAEKYAHLTLQTTSSFACVNMAAEGYPYLYESKKTVEVSGVTIPEWVILVDVKNNALTQVVYYDYNQLKKYGNGVKTSAHIATDGATPGMDPATVTEYIGFAPLCTSYTGSGMVQYYKYYYKDKNTDNTVSYILTADYADGKLRSVREKENYFIVDDLTVEMG